MHRRYCRQRPRQKLPLGSGRVVRWSVAVGGIDEGQWVGREDGVGRIKVSERRGGEERKGREARTLALVLDWWGEGEDPSGCLKVSHMLSNFIQENTEGS